MENMVLQYRYLFSLLLVNDGIDIFNYYLLRVSYVVASMRRIEATSNCDCSSKLQIYMILQAREIVPLEHSTNKQ